MAKNPYFTQGTSGEQNLIEDSIDSCIEIMHTALICGNLRIAEWARDRCITKDPSYPLPADFTNIYKLFLLYLNFRCFILNGTIQLTSVTN